MKRFYKLFKSSALVISLAINQLPLHGDDFIDNGSVVTIENESNLVLSETYLNIANGSELNLINTDARIGGGLSIGHWDSGDSTVNVIAGENGFSQLNIREVLNIGSVGSGNNSLYIQGTGEIDWEANTWDASAVVLAECVDIGIASDSNENSLILRDGAVISGPYDYSGNAYTGAVSNYSNGTIDIGSGCAIYTWGYSQDNGSVLRIGISEDSYGRIFVYGNVHMSKGTTINFYGVGNIADTIEDMKFIGGALDLEGGIISIEGDEYIFGDDELLIVLNDELNINTVSSLLNVQLKWVEDDDGTIWLGGDLTRIPLASCSGLEGSSLGLVADDIDAMAAVSGSNASLMIDRFNLMTGDEQRLELEAIYDEQLPVANTQTQAMHGFSRVLHNRTRKNGLGIDVVESDGPAGAMVTKNEWQSWMKAFGSITNVDSYDGHEGYDFDNYGTVIGLDKAEDGLTYGLAFGITQSDLESGNGNSANTDSYYGAFYGSYDADDWFVDLSLSYGYADIDARSGSVFDITSDYSADIFSFYLGTGKEFGLTDSLFIIPEISLQTTYYDQESYREDSSDAVGKDVDGYDRWSYLSTVGATLEFRDFFKNSSVNPELHAFWEHEFNTDEDDVSYALIGGTAGHSFEFQAPVADVVRLGVGISADVAKNVKLSAGYDIRLGDDYSSQIANAKLIYSF